MTKQNVLTTFLLALFAVSGPLAKFLATQFKLDNGTIEFILSTGQLATPLIAGGVYAFMNTLAAKIAAIQALPREQQTQVVSAIPIESRIAAAASLSSADAVKVANALPNEANLAAVNAMPEVTKVVVRDNASDGVGTALQDSNLEKVVPQSQHEDGKS